MEISKLDITNDEELVGATLQVIDEDGTVIEEWVSTNEPHIIEAKLIAGRTYTLTETATPDGYKIANSVDFTVNADGTVTPVVMYDEPVPDTPDTSTGDTTNHTLAWILLATDAVLMTTFRIISRKKKND